MADLAFTSSMQENVLTLIVMNNEAGGVAAGLVDVGLFEPPYNDIVNRAISYRKKYKKAPGEGHIADLFDHVLSDPKNKRKKLYTQVLGSIIELDKKINPQFVLNKLSDFQSEQNLRAATLEAAERLDRGGDDALSDTRNLLSNALKFKPQDIDKGMYLSDKKSIDFLVDSSSCDIYLGIKEFDKRGIGLTYGEALGFLAPKGRGKTWFCVHAGVEALMQGKKVLHISLEMKDKRIMPRYLRRLFAIAKRNEKARKTILQFDDLNRLIGIDTKLRKPGLTLDDPSIEAKIARKMNNFGVRLDRLHFKHFATSTLTMGTLNAYLDNLDASDGFQPDVLILDYPKLMMLNKKQDLRLALGQRMEELRGLLDERNMAGVFPFQGNRATETAQLITGGDIGEDYSLGQTVDNMLTYNQTPQEKMLKLARIYSDKARNDADGFTCLITQDYDTGQFVRQSALMGQNYFDLLKKKKDEDEDE